VRINRPTALKINRRSPPRQTTAGGGTAEHLPRRRRRVRPAGRARPVARWRLRRVPNGAPPPPPPPPLSSHLRPAAIVLKASLYAGNCEPWCTAKGDAYVSGRLAGFAWNPVTRSTAAVSCLSHAYITLVSQPPAPFLESGIRFHGCRLWRTPPPGRPAVRGYAARVSETAALRRTPAAVSLSRVSPCLPPSLPLTLAPCSSLSLALAIAPSRPPSLSLSLSLPPSLSLSPSACGGGGDGAGRCGSRSCWCATWATPAPSSAAWARCFIYI
jgi:hypothetical protein